MTTQIIIDIDDTYKNENTIDDIYDYVFEQIKKGEYFGQGEMLESGTSDSYISFSWGVEEE